MTVSSSTNKDTYAGNGSTTVFAFTFPVLDETHFTVQEVNDTTGVVTARVLTTDYTVSGTGNDTGRTNYTSGNITMLTAPASGVTLVIKRNLPFLQETDYVENDTFPAETHEEALDELTMADQQLKEQIDLSAKFNSSVSATVGDLPAPTADYYLKRNSANDGWEWTNLSATAGLGNVVEDTTPQLGGNLDVNGNNITSPDGTDLIDINDGSIDIQTNSSSRLDVTDSGLRLGGANARVTTVLDEDTMSSDSATSLATQQSIKAYVDTEVSGVVLDVASEAMTFTNKTFDANGTGNSISNIDVADLADGTDGELITWDSSGNPDTVAVGTAGQVLTSNGAGAAPTFQDASSSLSAASQAELEAATSTTVYTSPGRQQYHPSAAKAWCAVTGGGTPALSASYNVSSITDNGTGDYAVNFTTNFSSGNYSISAIVQRNSGDSNDRAYASLDRSVAAAAGSFTIVTLDNSGGSVDPQLWCVNCHGDQ